MGNKSTKTKTKTEKDGATESKEPKSSHPEKNIRMRKKQGAPRERPMSDGALSDQQPEIDFSQFMLTKQSKIDAKRIDGKGVRGIQEDLPATDYDPVGAGDEPPTGVQLSMLQSAFEQVLGIWPEYRPVQDLHSQQLSSAVVTTLIMVATRLFEQYHALKSLSEDVKELRAINEELKEECEAKKQLARKREVERKGLREDVAILRDELRKRGHDVKLPLHGGGGRQQVDSDDLGDDMLPSSETLSPRSEDSFQGLVTPRSDQSSDAEGDLRKRKKKGGIYAPTPLLIAEGGKSEITLKRAASLRTQTTVPGGGVHSPGNSPLAGGADIPSPGDDKWGNASDELKHKVKSLQLQLERERKEKILLQERLDGYTPGSKRLPSASGVSEIYQEEFMVTFRHLQHDAFDHVRRQVAASLPHVNTDKQHRFICAVMLFSHTVARERAASALQSVESLLIEPTRSLSSFATLDRQRPGTRRTGSAMENVRKLELADKQLQNKAQLGGRGVVGGVGGSRLPPDLLNRVSAFIEHSAETANVAPLTECVVDELQRDFADCLTPSLLNQPTFTAFLHGCCRLAWRFATVNPPYHLSAADSRYEPQYHQLASTTRVDSLDTGRGQHEIAFFLWPTLWSRKHGDVLIKGLVEIKL